MREVDWQYWMGWVVAAIISGMTLVAFALHTFFQHSMCNDEPAGLCFREWISATGSWAAVPAALLTIFFLSQQISKADRHHRQLIMFESDYKYELARRVSSMLKDANMHIVKVQIAAQTLDNQIYNDVFNDIVGRLQAHYGGSAFDEVDQMFLIPSRYSISEVREAIAGVETDPACVWVDRFQGSRVESALNVAVHYNEGVISATDAFVKRIDEMISL